MAALDQLELRESRARCRATRLRPSDAFRSLSGYAANVRAYLDTLPGPIVLIGHSSGGAVITNAATGAPRIRASSTSTRLRLTKAGP